MKTTEKQETETNLVVWNQNRKATRCFVCNEKFVEGNEVYIIKNNSFMARHATCARKKPCRSAAPLTEEEHLEKARRERPMRGSDKRQRTGGHGYTGGDGFKDL